MTCAQRKRLLAAAAKLSPAELETLLLIAERVEKGVAIYGHLREGDPRDFTKEAYHELVDATFYLAVKCYRNG